MPNIDGLCKISVEAPGTDGEARACGAPRYRTAKGALVWSEREGVFHRADVDACSPHWWRCYRNAGDPYVGTRSMTTDEVSKVHALRRSGMLQAEIAAVISSRRPPEDEVSEHTVSRYLIRPIPTESNSPTPRMRHALAKLRYKKGSPA